MNALIGRDDELGVLRRAIADGARVIGISGPVGAGKSALAAALAPTVTVPLDDVTTLAGAVSAIAERLAVPLPTDDGPSRAREGRLLGALSTRAPALVVLDGVDRVRSALEDALSRWRAATPDGVTFVLTARRGFEAGVDTTLVLSPLALPLDEGASAPMARARAMESPAVMLFVARARAQSPGFAVSDADAADVVAIVRALDGLPLAIVLAAARAPLLGLKRTRELLARRFELLVGGGAQGTSLAAAIASSIELASPSERVTLARASLFRGGFTVSSLHALSAAGAAAVGDELAVLADLEALLSASLVVQVAPPVAGRGARFDLYESVRELARTTLLTSDERGALAERHARYFVDAAEDAARRVRSKEGVAARAWLVEEQANVVAASEAPDAVLALRAALALEASYLARGPVDEHLERVTRLLARANGVAPRALVARAQTSVGLSEIYAGRRDDGVAHLKEALALATDAATDAEPDATATGALAATKAALILGLTGALDEANALFDRADALAANAPDPHLRGVVAKDRGMVLAEAGDNAAAIRAFEAALRGFRAAGDMREEGFTLAAIGARYVDQGALPEAKRHATAAVTMLEAVGDQRTRAWALLLLSLVGLEEAQLDVATAHAERAVALVRAVGDRLTEGLARTALAHAALEGRKLDVAAREYEAATECLESVGDRRNAAIALAAWGAAASMSGERLAAERLFARASAHADARGRPGDRETLALFAVVLAARGAEDAAARGDEKAARDMLDDASRVLHDVAADASVHRSDELRLALRVARAFRDDVAERVYAMLRSVFDTGPEERAGATAPLIVSDDGTWFRLPSGEVHKLRGRPVTGRLLRVLALRALEAPGTPVSAASLIDAGWPGEKILPKAAHNRLYVAMSRLRQLGLGELLENDGDGYFLRREVSVRVARERAD